MGDDYDAAAAMHLVDDATDHGVEAAGGNGEGWASVVPVLSAILTMTRRMARDRNQRGIR
jgi:hypothetical protein